MRNVPDNVVFSNCFPKIVPFMR